MGYSIKGNFQICISVPLRLAELKILRLSLFDSVITGGKKILTT